jgi:hypothetical protein
MVKGFPKVKTLRYLPPQPATHSYAVANNQDCTDNNVESRKVL